MLCGELGGGIVQPQLNLTTTRSPYSTLLNLYNMDITPPDEDVYLENGLLSYENPNYHLPNIDDALNSNTEISSYRQFLYSELETMCRSPATSNGRKTYASLDIGSMGVDITTGPVTTLDTDNCIHRNTCPLLDNTQGGNLNVGLELSATLRSNKPDLIEHSNIDSNRDYEKEDCALPDKNVFEPPLPSSPISTTNFSSNEELPPGWERHQDIDGPYYWHIKSGTIQRDAPITVTGNNEPKTPLVKDAETALTNFHQNGGIVTVTRSKTSSALVEELEIKKNDDRKEEIALKRRSYPARADREKDKAIRFAVRSLGWVDISEIDLTPERSSKAVNKCIVELSLGKNGLIDNVGRWGDGKDLFMDLDEGALKLIDPENLTVLNLQPIHTIRVWGVGRDNGRERDFAYVARDRITRKHMCHVFRCEMPARTIANTLRDICKKIMIERSLQQNLAKPVETSGSCGRSSLATRPTNLPTEHRKFHRNPGTPLTQSFPTPMEEPKKVLHAQYLGSIEVTKASGMDVLNDAIDQLMNTVPRNQWQSVDVAVAPSMITITPSNNKDVSTSIVECRVRYLSFLGIGHNVKQCAFIMHTAQDLFIAHVFHCEPSSGALCKTVEAACKLRYQKCLDAHPQSVSTSENKSPGRGIGATLKSLVGSITGRRSKKS
uniref:Amyloid beta A4 protein-binding family B member 2 n=1 Tax=Lygus hesperus TaxID=30085 RepID=A0A0A9X2N4_LYGHE